MRETTYVPGRAARWSSVIAGIISLVIAGYFVVAGAVEKATFFGTPPTAAEQARSEDLLHWALLVFFIGTPVAASVAWSCVRSVERHRSDAAGSCALLIALCGPIGFGAAMFAIAVLPSGARPVGFGLLWFIGGAVVFPLLVAASYRGRALTKS